MLPTAFHFLTLAPNVERQTQPLVSGRGWAGAARRPAARLRAIYDTAADGEEGDDTPGLLGVALIILSIL